MNIKLGLFLFLCFLIMNMPAEAQRQHSSTDQIVSLNWDIIGDIEFRLTDNSHVYPVYNSRVKRFANQSFTLEGYIIPLKNGIKQSTFMFSTLPINQCYFCGQNGNPIMIMVEMQEPLKFTFNPVKLRGILKLENTNAAERPPVTLKETKLIIENQ